MNANLSYKLPAAATSLAIALTIAACAATVPHYNYKPPAAGSSFVVARHNTGSYGSGSQTLTFKLGKRVWQGEKLNAWESQEGTLLARPDGAWVALMRGNTPLISFNPPVNWNYPLEVGKTWTTSGSFMVHANKRIVPFKSTVKVEAYEDVAVPAGTFKAYRVHTTDTLGNDNTDWLSPQLGIFIKRHLVRTAKSAQGPGTRDRELVSQNILK